jgi:hypothetical protein
MDIKSMIGLDQRGIKVTMFNAVTTAAVKMTGPACCP